MLFDKEQIELSLQEKVHEKIEILRHELAQSMFDSLSEELFYVYDKKEKDIIGGPFNSRSKAQSYADGLEDPDNLVVMSEIALRKQLKQPSENLFYVYDKKENDIIGGPFKSRSKAQSYADGLEDPDNLVVMSEIALRKQLKLLGKLK